LDQDPTACSPGFPLAQQLNWVASTPGTGTDAHLHVLCPARCTLLPPNSDLSRHASLSECRKGISPLLVPARRETFSVRIQRDLSQQFSGFLPDPLGLSGRECVGALWLVFSLHTGSQKDPGLRYSSRAQSQHFVLHTLHCLPGYTDFIYHENAWHILLLSLFLSIYYVGAAGFTRYSYTHHLGTFYCTVLIYQYQKVCTLVHLLQAYRCAR